MHNVLLAVCMDMYLEAPSMLAQLQIYFAVAVFALNHAFTLLSQYDSFYIGITVVKFISIYPYIGNTRYITHIPIVKLSLQCAQTIHG